MKITTAEELFRAVLHELRYEHTSSMTPEEFNYHGPIGMIEYIKTRWWAFDKHQKHIDDLSNLLVVTHGNGGMPIPLVNQGANTPGSEYFTVPYNVVDDTVDGKMFLINVRFRLAYDPLVCGKAFSGWKKAEYRRHETVENENYYYQPESGSLYYQQYNHKIWRIDQNSKSDHVASEAMISYIRYPAQVELDPITGLNVTNSDLDFRINVEVAKWIAHSYLETIESYRQQTLTAMQSGVFNQLGPATVR